MVRTQTPKFSFTRSSTVLLKVNEDTTTNTEYKKVQLLTVFDNWNQIAGENSEFYCSSHGYLEIKPV